MIAISVNDRPLSVLALVEHGRTLVPLRSVAQAVGAAVWYDGKHHTVAVSRGGKRVVIKPRLLSGRSYVPLRFIAERLGARVDYDSMHKLVRITQAALAYGASLRAPTATFQTSPPVPPPTTTQDYPSYGYSPYGSAQFNFYTTNGRAYYPGEWIHFVLVAPPGGTARLRLCTLSEYEMSGGYYGNRYEADIAAPSGYNITNCRVDVLFTAYGGQRMWVPVPMYIGLYTQAASGPAGAPQKVSQPPVIKRPEPTATPIPPPTPKPLPSARPQPTPQPVRTRDPIEPRRSPPPNQ